MLRLLTDENFNYKIVRGLRTRIPALDCLTVQEANLRGWSDEQLLIWATKAGRVVLTHDIQTMPAYVIARLESGLFTTGVVVVPGSITVRHAIEELELLIYCGTEMDVDNRVRFLPL